jgi:GTP-binding protein
LKPQQNDLDFLQWMGLNGLPFSIVFTKTDKLTVSQRHHYRKHYENVLLETWESLPPVFMTSSEKKNGREELMDYIFSLLK